MSPRRKLPEGWEGSRRGAPWQASFDCDFCGESARWILSSDYESTAICDGWPCWRRFRVAVARAESLSTDG